MPLKITRTNGSLVGAISAEGIAFVILTQSGLGLNSCYLFLSGWRGPLGANGDDRAADNDWRRGQ